MDKTALVLNYGEVPLVKTRYMKYLNGEENPYGKRHGRYNVYTGYNMEDSYCLTRVAERGCSGYFSCYELHEETNNSSEVTIETVGNIEELGMSSGQSRGSSTVKLNKYG
jgi:hypothetical protein